MALGQYNSFFKNHFHEVELENYTIFSAGTIISASSSGANNPQILIRNPSSSGKSLLFLLIAGNADIQNSHTTFGAFSTPTVTANGTTLNSYTRTIGSGATAVALLTTLPTISSNGNLLSYSKSGENTDMQNIIEPYTLLIPENNAVLITAKPKDNGRDQVYKLIWIER